MPNPYTDTCRPIASLIADAKAACEAVGVSARPYAGTTLKGLVMEAATAVTESAGEPTAVCLYVSSYFGNFPRRTSTIQIIVLSADSKVVDGVAASIAAARKIAAAIDDTVHQETDEEQNTITDKWTVAAEEVMDLPGLSDTAAVALSISIEDY